MFDHSNLESYQIHDDVSPVSNLKSLDFSHFAFIRPFELIYCQTRMESIKSSLIEEGWYRTPGLVCRTWYVGVMVRVLTPTGIHVYLQSHLASTLSVYHEPPDRFNL